MRVSGVILFAFFFMVGGLSYAASVGLPADAENGSGNLVLSVEGDYIFDKDYEAGTDKTEIQGSTTGLLKAEYAFNDNFGIYAKAGMSDLEVDLDIVGLAAADVAKYNIDYDYGPTFGCGAYVSYVWPELELKTTLNGQYFYRESEFDSLTVSGASPTITSSSDAELTEWSLSLLLSRKFELGNLQSNKLTPYVGVRYSDGEIDYGTVTHSQVNIGSTGFLGFGGDMDAKDNIGAIAGLSAQLGDSWAVSLEGRFVDEMAATGSLSYKF